MGPLPSNVNSQEISASRLVLRTLKHGPLLVGEKAPNWWLDFRSIARALVFRACAQKHANMLTGHIGAVSATQHCIELRLVAPTSILILTGRV